MYKMDTYVGITKPTPMDKHHLGSTQDSQFFVHKKFVKIHQKEDKTFKQNFLVGSSSTLRNPDTTSLIAPPMKPNVSNLVDARLALPVNPLAVK